VHFGAVGVRDSCLLTFEGSFVMLFWHVPAPNEALLISGSKRRKTEAQFRIVTGHGSFVLPVKQKARMLSLALREAVIEEECITNQGIRLNVRAVAAFKVGDDRAGTPGIRIEGAVRAGPGDQARRVPG
jgi:uncharacterized membrane protein YqiK